MTTPANPIVPPCNYCGPDCVIPFGYCHCGCRGKTKLCIQDSPKDNWIKGQPHRYIQHHHKRRNWAERFRTLPERPAHIPYGYCWCGCGGLAPLAAQSWPRLGVRKGEPMRHIKHHYPYTSGPEYLEEFRSEVPTITTACWIWQHAKGPLGYGARGGVDGTSRVAHVAVYERYHGKVPEGLELDHLCRVPSCVNPSHLEAVSHRVNMERSVVAKINHDIADAIRIRRKTGEHWKAIAADYGIGYSTIRMVCNNKTWVRELGEKDRLLQVRNWANERVAPRLDNPLQI